MFTIVCFNYVEVESVRLIEVDSVMILSLIIVEDVPSFSGSFN